MKSRNAKPLTTSATGAALAFSSPTDQRGAVPLSHIFLAFPLPPLFFVSCLPSPSVCSSFLRWSTAVCSIMSLRGRHRVYLFSTNTAASRQ